MMNLSMLRLRLFHKSDGDSVSNLSHIFQTTLDNIGLGGRNELRPVFYNSPVSIRFEIGVSEGVDTGSDEYLHQALFRAKSIYENLPDKPDILRIDVYADNIEDMECGFDKLKLGLPTEKVDCEYTDADGDIIQRSSYYWDLKLFDFDYERLLYEVIKSDFGGISFLDSVYFIDTDNAVLFCLYDDRGADVSAATAETILPLYERFNDYILDYDRAQIDRIFQRKI